MNEFIPKQKNITKEIIPHGESFLYAGYNNQLMMGESIQCDDCGCQCEINSQIIASVTPALHKFPVYNGQVKEISYCEANDFSVCPECWYE